MGRRIRTQKELPFAPHNGLQERVPILGCLGDRLAEAERVAGPIVDGEGEVVRGDCAGHGGATGADGGEGGGGAAVFENDAEVREALMEAEESGEEGGFGVEDRYCLGVGRRIWGRGGGRGVGGSGGDFAVEVEDHVLLFHFGEDGVECCVVDYT